MEASPVPPSAPSPPSALASAIAPVLALAAGWAVYVLAHGRLYRVAWDMLGVVGGFAGPSPATQAAVNALAFAVELPLFFVAGLAVSFVTRLIEEKDATKALDRLAERPFSGWAVRLPVMAAAVLAAWTLLSLA